MAELQEGMSDWIEVAQVDDIPVGEGREIVADDRILALYHLPDGWYAIEGTCPHHGGPLGQGTISGDCVVCPWHGLEVNVRTGEYHLGNPACLSTYRCRAENGRVYLNIVTTK